MMCHLVPKSRVNLVVIDKHIKKLSMSSCTCAVSNSCRKDKNKVLGSTLLFLLMPKCALCVHIYATVLTLIGFPIKYSQGFFWFGILLSLWFITALAVKLIQQNRLIECILYVSGIALLMVGRYYSITPLYFLAVIPLFAGTSFSYWKNKLVVG